MLYVILAYHVEGVIEALSPAEDAALMADLAEAHRRVEAIGRLGPAVRLGPTREAATLRGLGPNAVIDGPFAETKEALLGLYLLDCPDRDTAIEAARELRKANPSAVYEIRPALSYREGRPMSSS
jgi:hypothetical protein